MKNKYNSYIVKLLVFSVIVIAYLTYTHPKEFDDLIGTSDKSITKIILTSGSSGAKVIIADKEQIQQFINLVTKRHYSRLLDQFTSRSGWGYRAEFFESNTRLVELTYGSSNEIKVNNTKYNVDNPISYEETDKLFKSLHNKIAP
jgi:hypothetical protein